MSLRVKINDDEAIVLASMKKEFYLTRKVKRLFGYKYTTYSVIKDCYLVLILRKETLKEIAYISTDEILRVIDKTEPAEWIYTEKIISKFIYEPMYGLFDTFEFTNVRCYLWMVENNSFFASVSEDPDYALEMLYKKMPELLNDKWLTGEITNEEY
jgi:hypothetical protein